MRILKTGPSQPDEADSLHFHLSPSSPPSFPLFMRRGIADAEIKVSSVENPEQSEAPAFKPGIGQNVAFYASLTARMSTFHFCSEMIISRG